MKKIVILALGLLLLVGCTQTTDVQVTRAPTQMSALLATDTKVVSTNTSEPTETEVLSTDTSEPTDTPEPTAMEAPPTTTPLPENLLFRDDFEGVFQPGWEWVNENSEKWSFVEFGGSYWLRIVGDKPGNFDAQTNTLMRALPEGDFAITAHIVAEPKQNHHQANIFIFEDVRNYIRMNFGYCDHCGLPEGYGYFMETVIENN